MATQYLRIVTQHLDIPVIWTPFVVRIQDQQCFFAAKHLRSKHAWKSSKRPGCFIDQVELKGSTNMSSFLIPKVILYFSLFTLRSALLIYYMIWSSHCVAGHNWKQESQQALSSAVKCTCTMHLGTVFILPHLWPLVYSLSGRHTSFPYLCQ